jgi:perosamine synthetase
MMTTILAIDGGEPVRKDLLPYGRQSISEADVGAVVEALQSDWLTTGPRVAELEGAFAAFVGTREAVAVANGTAALHATMAALEIGPGDEVIVPPMTFAATANSVLYRGARPIFADVEPDTLLLDPMAVSDRIGPRTRAIIAVDYAGQPCDYDALRGLAEPRGLALVADACHAVGGALRGRSVGTLADLSTFSLHPVKHFTAGEGGLVSTDDPARAAVMRRFRNHGITTDHRQRAEAGSWFYEMTELGFNYRLTDIQCALATSQLVRLPSWVERRRHIAAAYDRALNEHPAIRPLAVHPEARHAYHLYVVRLRPEALRVGRKEVFAALRAEGIGCNVHYVPVHLHPYYQRTLGTGPGLCPVAEAAYKEILSLPMFSAMTDQDVSDVLKAVTKVCEAYAA